MSEKGVLAGRRSAAVDVVLALPDHLGQDMFSDQAPANKPDVFQGVGMTQLIIEMYQVQANKEQAFPNIISFFYSFTL